MRAMKRTVSVLLSLMLVLGMMTIGMSAVGAAETNKVNVTSNIGASTSVDYTADSEQVTVTYKLKADLGVLNTQGVITYDTAVLKLTDSSKSAAVAFPTMTTSASVNFKDGRVVFNFSDPALYDFSTESVYATLVFDIIGTGDTTVNLNVDVLTGCKKANSTSADDVNFVYYDDIDTTKFTAKAEAKVTPEDNLVDFSTFLNRYGSNLEGKVGLVYIFNKAPKGYDTSKLTVEFAGPDDSTGEDSQNVTMKYTDMTSISSRYLRHDYSLKSTMFSQPITATIYENGKAIAKDTYSIEQYILDKPATDPIAQNLNNALLNYGAYAQLTFDAYTDNLANKSIDAPLQNVTADDIVLPSGVGEQPDLSSLGLTFWMEGAELEADTAIRVYYRITNSSKFASATATYNGANLPFNVVNSTRRMLYIPNISSADYDTTQVITFSNGATYKTSILAQLKNKLIDNPDDNLAKAMYWYNQAANAYFED